MPRICLCFAHHAGTMLVFLRPARRKRFGVYRGCVCKSPGIVVVVRHDDAASRAAARPTPKCSHWLGVFLRQRARGRRRRPPELSRNSNPTLQLHRRPRALAGPLQRSQRQPRCCSSRARQYRRVASRWFAVRVCARNVRRWQRRDGHVADSLRLSCPGRAARPRHR